MNILSKPLVNYVILWEKLDFDMTTSYNSLKNKFNFIKYKLISKCTYIFLHFVFLQLNKSLFFPIYHIIEDLFLFKFENLVSFSSRGISVLSHP